MAAIKYRISGKTENQTIYLRLSLARKKVFEKKTGLSINKSEWSKTTSLPKQTSTKNKNLGSDLRKLETHIYDCLNNAQSKGTNINSKWLGTQIDIYFERINPIGKSELVVDSIQHILNTVHLRKNQLKELGLSKSRVNGYNALLRTFLNFQGVNKYKVKDVSFNLGNAFLKYLIDDCNYAQSTALRIMGNLKTVCYDAELNGIEISRTLRKLESGKPSNEHLVYLTPLELEKIEKATISQPYLQNARKWLLLGCNIGQRVSDLLQITEKNFVTRKGLEVIELKQKKTGKYVTIPLLDTTREIIIDGLPYQISDVNFNKYIKKVCDIAELHEQVKGFLMDKKIKRKVLGTYPKYKLIASHVCRRSFATNLYGVLPTPLIMQITQHGTEKSLLGYIGKSNYDYAQQIADFYEKQNAKAKKETQLHIVKRASSN